MPLFFLFVGKDTNLMLTNSTFQQKMSTFAGKKVGFQFDEPCFCTNLT